MKELTLRQLCEACGVSRRAVQGYEKAGLVKPTGKNFRGYLLYDEEAQKAVLGIKRLQDFGFPVKEIALFQSLDTERRIEILVKKSENLQKKRAMTDECIRLIAEMIEAEKQKLT